MKIIEREKFRRIPNDVLVAENITVHKFAVAMCLSLNERFSSEREFRVEDDSYVLRVEENV